MRTIRSIDTVLALLALIVILLSACTTAQAPSGVPAPSTSTPEPLSEPRLRIRNAGEIDIQNLVVMFPDSRIEFGDVPAGITSEYQPAPNGVYNYAAYEYDLNGETKTQFVIDWVGESPRPGQSYTYVVEFDPEAVNMPVINLVEVLADLN